MLLLFSLIVVLFLLHSNNLLMSLIILEILSFFMIYFTSHFLAPVVSSDLFLLIVFSIFVMEGVIALSGLITLVTFVGSDYLSSSTFLKL